MRLASCIAAALLFCGGAPALATSTIGCTVADYPGMDLAMTVGHGVGAGIVQATISDGGEEISTVNSGGAAVAQAWIDEDTLKLDLVDANAARYLVRLDTRRRGNAYVGTLLYRGRTWRVRCEEAS
ncbi:MAG: hypothetical protein ACT4N8_03660 [Sphingosinicella sp.]|uniref:hypothetical protein n=1 Tax=Sphingosinicella sp. TaxID=1917971 RepID=UPI004037CD0D